MSESMPFIDRTRRNISTTMFTVEIRLNAALAKHDIEVRSLRQCLPQLQNVHKRHGFIPYISTG